MSRARCDECGYLCDDPRRLNVRKGGFLSNEKSSEVYCQKCFEKLQYRQLRGVCSDLISSGLNTVKHQVNFNRTSEEDLIDT